MCDFLCLLGEQVLGSGQFGVVIKGFVTKNEEQLVAVKTVKPNVDAMNFLALLSEIMAYLENHENIASLVAACTANIKNSTKVLYTKTNNLRFH